MSELTRITEIEVDPENYRRGIDINDILSRVGKETDCVVSIQRMGELSEPRSFDHSNRQAVMLFRDINRATGEIEAGEIRTKAIRILEEEGVIVIESN